MRNPFEAEISVKKDLNTIIEQLLKINPNDYVRADELGKALSFEACIPLFERIMKLLKDFYECDLEDIPYDFLNSVKSPLNEIQRSFEQIRTFNVTSGSNPANEQQGFINSLKNAYESCFRTMTPLISYSASRKTNSEILSQAGAILSDLKRIQSQTAEAKSKILDDANETIGKVRQIALEVGVSQHAVHFKNEADDHIRVSRHWLIATIGVAILTACWGIGSFFITPSTEPTIAIQYILSKIIILSALYYGLVWSARNYNAHRHNYVVNRHRQNALTTFETFAKAAAQDFDTKNAVLLQTTQAIFSNQPTGYIIKDNESESPNKIIEILRGASSSGQKN